GDLRAWGRGNLPPRRVARARGRRRGRPRGRRVRRRDRARSVEPRAARLLRRVRLPGGGGRDARRAGRRRGRETAVAKERRPADGAPGASRRPRSALPLGRRTGRRRGAGRRGRREGPRRGALVITVPVRAGERRYEVSIGSGLIDRAGELLPELPRAKRAFVVSDPVAADLYGEMLAAGLAGRGWDAVALRVPQGEEAKTLQVTEMLYRQLAAQEAHREDVVLGLGGGAAGDLAGFVGATYMRGLHVVQ